MHHTETTGAKQHTEVTSTTGAATAYGRDEADRALARRAVVISAVGLAATGAVEMVVAVVTGSVALLGDALHNLSDVSTSLVVGLGFWVSRRPASRSHPYGYERAEDLAGLGIAFVIWASAVFAGVESYRKFVSGAVPDEIGLGIVAALLGVVGNQAVAVFKRRVGTRIGSATLVADARHSWLDALASVGALVGLLLVGAGYRWGDAVAGFAVTLFIVHVGVEVTRDLVGRLMDGLDPAVLMAAEQAAQAVPGVRAATVRGRWTGRTLRLEIETDLAADLSLAEADGLARRVEAAVAAAVPAARLVHCDTHATRTQAS